jgi:hypothetical protein
VVLTDDGAYTFSADELNNYFATLATSTDSFDFSHISNRPLIKSVCLSFSCIDVICVAGLNGVSLVFIKVLLSLILLTNFILISYKYFIV